METFDKLTKLVHSIPKLHEAGYKKGKEEGYKSGYDKGKEEGIAIGTSAFDQPLHIVENGEYISPSGKRYNPITVNVPGEVYEDVPLTVTENGTYEAPQKTRYTPITVEVIQPKPTLNAPLISVNTATLMVNITDYLNGNFSKEYVLYVDGEQRATYTDKTIPVQADEIEGKALQVKCKNDKFFNESGLSNAVTWDLAINGSFGLLYEVDTCIGIGSVTEDIIYVASIYNGTIITKIGKNTTKTFWDLDGKTVFCPDSITTTLEGFRQCKNCTFVFGENFIRIEGGPFSNITNTILDFSKVKGIPTIVHPQWAFYDADFIAIVSDDMYDNWVVATNWVKFASSIIRESEWIAQGGAT